MLVPGRFLKHIDLSDVETESDFQAKLESDLPDRTKWRHPATGEIFDVDRRKSKQMIIDRVEDFFQVKPVQEAVISNVSNKLESAENLEDVKEIPVTNDKFTEKSTFNELQRIKSREAKQKGFQLRQLLNEGNVSDAIELAGRELTSSEQARAILGREPSASEIINLREEGSIN